MGWRKTIKDIPKEETSKAPSWRDSIQDVVEPISKTESFIRGAGEMASLGLGDEFSSAMSNPIGAVKQIGNLLGASFKDEDIDAYIAQRDANRKAQDEAAIANPKTNLAGNLVGGLATSVIPGASTLKGAVVAGAGLGLGTSKANDIGGLLMDAETGAAGNALGYGIGEKVIGPAAKYAKNKIGEVVSPLVSKADDYLTKKIGRGLFGVDEKATELYLKNPNKVNQASTMGELAESILSKTDDNAALNEMKLKASDLSADSFEVLDQYSGMSKSGILKAINDAQDDLLVDGHLIGGAQEKAFNTLKKLSTQVNSFEDDINQRSLKRIIQNLDGNIQWNNPEMGPTNDALKNIRGYIDHNLKTMNPAYKTVMAETEDVTKAIQQVKSVFENRTNPQSYDKFNKSIKNLINKDEMSAANQAVDKIEKHTDFDLRSDISNSWAKDQFSKGDINGSRKTVLGSVIGGSTGALFGPLGATVGNASGAGIGFAADRYSGPIFKKMLDGKLTLQEISQNLAPRLGKYAKPLIDAANRGGTSLTTTHFLMQQNDPTYRKLIQDMEKENE
jgi:hypothetical protein